jgi:cytochrome P450 family 135
MPVLSVQDYVPASAAMVPPRLRRPEVWQVLRRGLDPEGYLLWAQRRLGDVFIVRMFGEPIVVFGHPDAVDEILSRGPDDLSTGDVNESLKPIFGSHNFLHLDGDEHLSRRKMVLPPLHGERLRSYEDTIREAVASEISSWPVGVPVETLPRLRALACSIILRCLCGRAEDERLRALGDASHDLVDWIGDPRRAFVYLMLGPDRLMELTGFRRRKEALDGHIAAEVAERREMTDEDLLARGDILSLLMVARDEAGGQLSDIELIDEVILMLIAGHETSASMIAWTLHELARDPASQDRLASEPEVFTNAVITETLRLRPPLSGVLRRLRKPIKICGYELPAGTNLMLSQSLVHRRPDLYPDPWAFKPERFLHHRPATSEWFPFGGSVRRCIGASFAQVQARIMLEVTTAALRLKPDRLRPEKTIYRALLLAPARGARVIATAR